MGVGNRNKLVHGSGYRLWGFLFARIASVVFWFSTYTIGTGVPNLVYQIKRNMDHGASTRRELINHEGVA